MNKNSFLRWFWNAIPRAPRRAGVLMRIYYCWQENFTPAGHAAAAMFMLAMAAGMVPGFWAAWIFCGLDFLFFLTLIPTWYLTTKNRIDVDQIQIHGAEEGEEASAEIHFTAVTNVDAVSFGCFRMDPSLKLKESDFVTGLKRGQKGELRCRIQTKYRGEYLIPKVSLLVPEVKGMLRYSMECGSAELLVYPRVIPVGSFPFLTSGMSGMVFAPLLMPSLSRGLDFVGVREYREGDSLRDLHHKAFARYGRPFTKEFETERGAGAVLVLDVRTRSLKEKVRVEPLIRLAAGIGSWLNERGALGRFFIGDEEISLVAGDGGKSFMEALARVPRTGLVPATRSKSASCKKGEILPWSPAARPMGPVLRLGLFETEDGLIHKHVVVTKSSGNRLGEIRTVKDNVLEVSENFLDAGEVSL